MAVTLKSILVAWSGAEREATRDKLLNLLIQRDWTDACRAAVQENDLEAIEQWMRREDAGVREVYQKAEAIDGSDGFYAAQLEAYLFTAKAALLMDANESERLLAAAGRRTHLPEDFYRDLCHYFKSSSASCIPSRTPPQRIGVLLQGRNTGVVGTLLLEKIASGTGKMYPTPMQGFLFRDQEFREAEALAGACAQRLKQVGVNDVRWTLEFPEVPEELEGGSLGGAYAVGLYFLFQRPCDLSTYAISATIDASGRLSGVDAEGLETKLEAARLSERKFRAVFIARENASDALLRKFPSLRTSNTVEDVAGQILSERRHARRKGAIRLASMISFAPSLAFLFWLMALFLSNYTYHFVQTSGGRILVSFGLSEWRLPFLNRGDLDTGFVRDEFRPDALSQLLNSGTHYNLHRNPAKDWVYPLSDCLQNISSRVDLWDRYGEKKRLQELLMEEFNSSDPYMSTNAALRLIQADEANRPIVREKIRGLFERQDYRHGELYARIGQVLIEIDPSYAPQVIAGMYRILKDDTNNWDRIPALHTIWLADKKAIPPSELAHLQDRMDNDQAHDVGVRAAYELALIDSDKSYLALNRAMLDLTDHDTATRYNSYRVVRIIGTLYPERALSFPALFIQQEKGIIERSVKDNPNAIITLLTAKQIDAIIQAPDERTLHYFAERVADFKLDEKKISESIAYIGGIKLALLARQYATKDKYDPEIAVSHLLAEMKTPLADHWAVYRYACAHAISLCISAPDRSKYASSFQQLWHQEKQPHLRIALAITLEDLEFQPDKVPPIGW